jgi:hypothetical protein
VKCNVEKLSALLDGDLGAREAAKLRAHVDGCAACRGELAALDQMRQALAAESAHAPAPSDVEGDGWAQLAARLGATPAAPERRFRLGWLLAPAGAMALLAAIGGGIWLRHLRAPTPSDDTLIAEAEGEFRAAEAQYQRALEKLRTVADGMRAGWPEPKRRDYDAAQASLEAAVEQCRNVARSRPSDPEAEELLFAAYRKQIDFVQTQLLQRAVVAQ